jgi:hypothetical protein
MRPASTCCWISVAHASLYFCGVVYNLVVISFDVSLSLMRQTTSSGSLANGGTVGWKMSLNSSMTSVLRSISFCCAASVSSTFCTTATM